MLFRAIRHSGNEFVAFSENALSERLRSPSEEISIKFDELRRLVFRSLRRVLIPYVLG